MMEDVPLARKYDGEMKGMLCWIQHLWRVWQVTGDGGDMRDTETQI